ncbi:reverse transcriptase family protein [Georgenia sp. 311]|uniref:reverse transcriptase family protein n=1 Tax=Georgenia sp. 311 TaxID=2585134 RepID=UPI00159B9EB0|nr:reverse transcriptase family protein [Georgenia sp. 311]
MLKQLNIGLARVSNYSPPHAVHGFIRGRDIRTNAAQHLDKDIVLRVDLRDFFGSIDAYRLTDTLTGFGFDQNAASAVLGVTIVNGSLAQGFSTSPLLSNMTFADADLALMKLAADVGVSYSRYVDDLTFSGSFGEVDDRLLLRITDVLESAGWIVNSNKTRFMRRGKAQYVTGLYVGDAVGPHIPRSMKRLLRREVYFASKFGIDNARLRSPTPMEHDRLNGWVHYAAHADPHFGQNLRDAWATVDSRRPASRSSAHRVQILDEIDFPES